jgi:alpha 1,3-glucosidase
VDIGKGRQLTRFRLAQPYYNYFSHQVYPASKRTRHVKVPAPLETFPVLLQGGSILSIRARARKASTLMWRDPFTLIIAVGVDGNASGKLYLDDGDSYDYEQGQSIWREFKLQRSGKKSTLSSHSLSAGLVNGNEVVKFSPSSGPWAKGIANVEVEHILVLGLDKEPSSIIANGVELEWTWQAGSSATTSSEGTASKLSIKNPKLKIAEDWSIVL